MNLIQLTILTNLAEGELSIKELSEYIGTPKKTIAKSLSMLENKGYVEKRALIGKDIIYSITDAGLEELYRNYLFIKKLLDDMEFTLCNRFDC
ncbi:helix-turn-helix domain-containing protein [Acidianus manzaensis]|uniref:MarR family transcriptional regulator n=1 Tax=Acidianus manzaensis TaxID=282676 RepID=A0A1W6K0I6_9CREN|nr:helix-turn-helix domain-containing protein [Acidianus manzaensis]ARM76036.1 MarR family transcriptional regulator [Acidianus manzaensis]